VESREKSSSFCIFFLRKYPKYIAAATNRRTATIPTAIPPIAPPPRPAYIEAKYEFKVAFFFYLKYMLTTRIKINFLVKRKPNHLNCIRE